MKNGIVSFLGRIILVLGAFVALASLVPAGCGKDDKPAADAAADTAADKPGGDTGAPDAATDAADAGSADGSDAAGG
jgi:hypothetical protein